MPFLRIDHIGVAVDSLEEAAAKFRRVFGLAVAAQEVLEDQQVIAALVPTATGRFELLQPTNPESVVGRFLARRGEGVHHICFEVINIAGEIELLKSRQVQLVQGTPRRGFVGQIEFVHPRSAGGILVEMAEVSLRTPTTTPLRLGHVAIATKDRAAAAELWKKNFHLVEGGQQEADSAEADGARSVALDAAGPQGRRLVQFVEPVGPSGPIAEFIEKRGEGVYSLTLQGAPREVVSSRRQGPGKSAVIPPEEFLGMRLVLREG